MMLRGVIFCLLCSSVAHSQNRQIKFGRITTDDGLSDSRVFDVASDSTGFLWIATMSGLDRFDGHRFRHYYHNPRDTTSIPFGEVTALVVGRKGAVWVGTFDGGVARYIPDRDYFLRVVDVGARVNQLLEDSDGNLWIATRGNGLTCLPQQTLPAMPQDPRDLTAQKVFRSNLQDPATGIADNEVSALLEDRDGTIWIGTEGGLDRLTISTMTFVHCSEINDPVRALDAGWGFIWVGTSRGLLKVNGKGHPLSRYVHDSHDVQTISYDEITSIEGGNGFLWIGTREGLNRMDPEKGGLTRCYHNPSVPASLLHDFVFSLSMDNSGTLWIGTNGGLNKLTATSEFLGYHLYGDPPSLPQDVTALHFSDPDETLWIGTWGKGLIAICKGSSKSYKHDPNDPKSLSTDEIFTVYEDSRGIIWIGTAVGLDRLDSGRKSFRRYTWDVEKDFCSIISIAEDSQGHLWLGTTVYGVILLDPSTGDSRRLSHVEENPTSLSSSLIRSVLPDRDGGMWVGTAGGGLNRYDPRRDAFVNYNKGIGVRPGRTISMLSRDGTARIWIAASDGLYRLDPEAQEFHEVVLDSLREVAPVQMVCDNQNRMWVSTLQDGIYLIEGEKPILHVSESDGLQGNKFTYAGCITRKGELIFGGPNGYNIFRSEDILVDRKPPGVVLTDFSVFNKPLRTPAPVWELGEITLPYDENYFSVEFSALDHAAPEKIVYSFRLDGLDKTWSRSGTEPFASYQAVSPGSYTLRVRASNGLDSGEKSELAIPIIVLPPFWQTVWFKGMVVLLAIGVLVSIYNYLTYQIRRLEGIRQQIADDLHDDIGSRLVTIRGRIELFRARRDIEDNDKNLTTASQVTVQAADAIRNVVWFLNPDYNSADDVVTKMKGAASRMLAGIEHAFEDENKATLPIMDMEFRRNLVLLFQESLNNIVKHAGAKRVDIRLSIDDRNVVLTVADDGAGFNPEEKKEGHGLGSLKHRATQMNGVVTVASSPGSGTKLTLHAPLPKLPLVVRLRSAVMRVFKHQGDPS